MEHLYWHKKRLTILGPKIEGLPDGHSSKPQCLFNLGWLFKEVGNWVECKRLLTHALELWRGQGNDPKVAQVLRFLSDVNRLMSACKEGIEQAREAVEINKRLGDTAMQVDCLINLAFLLREDEQLDAAEEATLHAINLIGEQGNQFQLCESYRALGDVYESRGEAEKAIPHFKTALEIATAFGWHDILSWTHYSLARLFCDDGRFEDAQIHIEHAKSHAASGAYILGRATRMQALIWYRQHRLEEAGSEALRAINIYEQLGAVRDLGSCREFFRDIQGELDSRSG